MDAATKERLEALTKAALGKLREALEECKDGRYASASCAATEAERITAELNDAFYEQANAVYNFPQPPFSLPPVLPTARIVNYPMRPWLKPHGDHAKPTTVSP